MLGLAQVVEQARRGKLVGASLEARVVLWLQDEGLREAVQALNSADNGVDPLRYLFITSQVPSLKALVLRGAPPGAILCITHDVPSQTPNPTAVTKRTTSM